MKVETVIQCIEDEMAQVSRDAMERPADQTGWAYAKAVGFYGGLDKAKELILSLYRDADERDRRM